MTNQINNQSIIPSTDVIQLTLTLKMTTARFVETSVTVNNNSPIQDYVQPHDRNDSWVQTFHKSFLVGHRHSTLHNPPPLFPFLPIPYPFRFLRRLTSANMVGPFRALILWLLPLYSTNSMRLYPRYPLLAPAFLLFKHDLHFVSKFRRFLCDSL